MQLFVKTREFDEITLELENKIPKIRPEVLILIMKSSVSLTTNSTKIFTGKRLQFLIDQICLFFLKSQIKFNFLDSEKERKSTTKNEKELKNVDLLSQEELFEIIRISKIILKVAHFILKKPLKF